MNTSGTPLVELERLHGSKLAAESFLAWEVLTKAIEKERGILEMVKDVESRSEAWRALTKNAAETQVEAYDRARSEFESIKIGVSKPVAGHFARVHVALTKLTRHQVTIPAREIKRRVLSGLTPRFPDDVRVYTIKGGSGLKDPEPGLARVESFSSTRRGGIHQPMRLPLPIRAAAGLGLEA